MTLFYFLLSLANSKIDLTLQKVIYVIGSINDSINVPLHPDRNHTTVVMKTKHI